jgi:hypothetical protein
MILETTEAFQLNRRSLTQQWLKARSAHGSVHVNELIYKLCVHVNLSREPGNQIVSGGNWLIFCPAIVMK